MPTLLVRAMHNARNRVHFVILIIITIDASVQTTVSKLIDVADLRRRLLESSFLSKYIYDMFRK